ncbi:MAG: sulfatase-like hydrolase/transferase [Haliscomenobacter sp.]|nr:sulfatase-like hydrolase/transferase [Haliscomenobacter sp.]
MEAKASLKKAKTEMVKILLLCFVFSSASVLAQSSRKPNIVFILSDDLSYRDLSCYGQKQFSTPQIDAFASTSTRFVQAYSAAPECAPSRGCLLTGIHAGKGPIRNNSSARGFEFLPDDAFTFAELLKKAGYTTAVVGKWGLGNKNTPGFPLNQGFDYHFGYLSHYEAHSYFPWKLYENGKEVLYPKNQGFKMDFLYQKEDNPYAHNYEGMYNKEGKLTFPAAGQRTYATDEMDEKSLAFISKNKDRPFFLFYTTNLPHGPAIVDDLRQMTGKDSVPILSREWGAMVERLDISVGKIIRKLKEEGLYDQTIILFASDNGYSMHNLKKDDSGNTYWPDDEWLHNKGAFDGGKFSVKEGGLRIPFFIHYPGQQKASAVSQPVWLVDVFPTLAELTHQRAPKDLDGYSLLPFLIEKPARIPENRAFYFFKNDEQAVRQGAWFGYRKRPGDPLRLFLPEEDPICEHDLAPFFPKVVNELESFLNTAHTPHPWYWNPGDTQAVFDEKGKGPPKAV